MKFAVAATGGGHLAEALTQLGQRVLRLRPGHQGARQCLNFGLVLLGPQVQQPIDPPGAVACGQRAEELGRVLVRGDGSGERIAVRVEAVSEQGHSHLGSGLLEALTLPVPRVLGERGQRRGIVQLIPAPRILRPRGVGPGDRKLGAVGALIDRLDVRHGPSELALRGQGLLRMRGIVTQISASINTMAGS